MTTNHQKFDANLTSALTQCARITEEVGLCAQVLLDLRWHRENGSLEEIPESLLDETESRYESLVEYMACLADNVYQLRWILEDEDTEDGDA